MNNKKQDEVLLQANEQVIWRNILTKGFFNKKIIDTQIITNFRVIRNDYEIPLQDLDDIVIMNRHRQSQSQYTGVRSRGMGMGQSNSRGYTFGNIVFIYQGVPAIIFYRILDPQGIVNLTKSARKKLIQEMKLEEKSYKKRLIEEEKFRKRASSLIVCNKCNKSNPSNSRFCSQCGSKLIVKCEYCKSDNEVDISFCVKCGSEFGINNGYSVSIQNAFDILEKEKILTRIINTENGSRYIISEPNIEKFIIDCLKIRDSLIKLRFHFIWKNLRNPSPEEREYFEYYNGKDYTDRLFERVTTHLRQKRKVNKDNLEYKTNLKTKGELIENVEDMEYNIYEYGNEIKRKYRRLFKKYPILKEMFFESIYTHFIRREIENTIKKKMKIKGKWIKKPHIGISFVTPWGSRQAPKTSC